MKVLFAMRSFDTSSITRQNGYGIHLLRTSRLDLDDYNKEVEEGCHITSMAGTWMSIVEGFGGMQQTKQSMHFSPKFLNGAHTRLK
jgi:trehalose/maltose hydrolase-like predicted phosphorylase